MLWSSTAIRRPLRSVTGRITSKPGLKFEAGSRSIRVYAFSHFHASIRYLVCVPLGLLHREPMLLFPYFRALLSPLYFLFIGSLLFHSIPSAAANGPLKWYRRILI